MFAVVWKANVRRALEHGLIRMFAGVGAPFDGSTGRTAASDGLSVVDTSDMDVTRFFVLCGYRPRTN